MGRIIEPIQTTYTSGELDPKLAARRDVRHYYSGAERLRNVLPIPQGGVRRRPGLEFIEALKPQIENTAADGTESAPNGGTAANLTDNDLTSVVLTTNSIGTTDPYVICHIDMGAAVTVYFADAVGLKLSATGDTDEVRIQWSTDDSAWNDIGDPFDSVTDTEISRRRSDFGAAVTARYWRIAKIGGTDLTTLKFSIQEMRLWTAVDPAALSELRIVDHQFSELQRYTFAITDHNARVYIDGVYQADFHVPYFSGELGDINWTQSLDTLLLFHRDVQPQKILRSGAHDEWNFEPLAFSNIIQFDFGGGDEDVWSDTRGWPRCGVFHEGRFWLAGSAQRPQTLWGSKNGDFFDFDIGTSQADEAIDVTLDTDEVAAIYHLESAETLFLTTSAGVFFILPDNDAITPDNIQRKRVQGKHKAQGPGLRAYQVGRGLMFVQQGGKAVQEVSQGDFSTSYDVQNVSLLSPHLIRTPIDVTLRRALSTDEGDLLLLVNSDGSMSVLQTLRSQDITAWVGWHTEGNFIAGGVDFGDIYVGTERVIDGSVVHYLERFGNDRFTDCGVLVTTGLPASVIAGLDHLEGATVDIRIDGAAEGQAVVVGGQVTLPFAATTSVEVGLPFADPKEAVVNQLIADGLIEIDARKQVFGVEDGAGMGDQIWIRDMPADVPASTEVQMRGRRKSVFAATVMIDKTQGFYFGANGADPDIVSFQEFGDFLLDRPAPVRSGDIRLAGLQGYTLAGQTEITQRNPAPMIVLGVVREIEVS